MSKSILTLRCKGISTNSFELIPSCIARITSNALILLSPSILLVISLKLFDFSMLVTWLLGCLYPATLADLVLSNPCTRAVTYRITMYLPLLLLRTLTIF